MIYEWLYLCFMDMKETDKDILTQHPVAQAITNKKYGMEYAENVYNTFCYDELGDYPYSGREYEKH